MILKRHRNTQRRYSSTQQYERHLSALPASCTWHPAAVLCLSRQQLRGPALQLLQQRAQENHTTLAA
jgi:hypothetical protein